MNIRDHIPMPNRIFAFGPLTSSTIDWEINEMYKNLIRLQEHNAILKEKKKINDVMIKELVKTIHEKTELKRKISRNKH